MAGNYRVRGGSEWEEGEECANETIDAQKALFGDVRPWKHRSWGVIEAEYVDSLKEERSVRDANLFELLTTISEMPARVADLAQRMSQLEGRVTASRTHRLRWQAWLGNAHSAVYLMELSGKESGGRESVGNLLNSSEARSKLKTIIGRNKAIEYAACLDEYVDLKCKIANEQRLSGIDFKFISDRTKHPVVQWSNSVGQFWEALSGSTKQNIERYLELDEQAGEVAFEFNFDRQPIRWRTIVCRPPLSKTDPLGPGFPEFRVVTNLDRTTGKRQTKGIVDYKRALSVKALERSLAKEMGRAPSKAELQLARQALRKRACSVWITEELLAHCKLGKHTTKINRLQRRLQMMYGEWTALRERLTALIV